MSRDSSGPCYDRPVKRSILCSLLLACNKQPAPVNVADSSPAASSAPAPSTTAAALAVSSLPFPGAVGPVVFDYVAFERAANRIWLPASNGSVYVLDVAKKSFARIEGFPTGEREAHGQKRPTGPSSVTIGDGFAYVGDRATNDVCAIDLKSLEKRGCYRVPVPIDGVAWVASKKEVWVTTPSDHSLTVLDVQKPETPKSKLAVKAAGEVEGYAVDAPRGLFFTNLEDADKTLAVDIDTHLLKSTWNPACGEKGPRGVAVDSGRGLVIVACTDGLRVLDAAGTVVSKLDGLGAGIDNLDYVESTGSLYVAAAKDARVSIVRVEDGGKLVLVASSPTCDGCRNAIVDGVGSIYLADPKNARLVIVSH